MPLSIVRCGGLDVDDAPTAALSHADLLVLSFSDAELARYARVWDDAGQRLPGLYLADVSSSARRSALVQQFGAIVGRARGVLIRLPRGLEDWRDGVEAIAALARDRRIALAVITDAGQADPRLDALSNLPRSTLRRLTQLCRGDDEGAARAVLTQLSLAAGLTIEPWLDRTDLSTEPQQSRGAMR